MEYLVIAFWMGLYATRHYPFSESGDAIVRAKLWPQYALKEKMALIFWILVSFGIIFLPSTMGKLSAAPVIIGVVESVFLVGYGVWLYSLMKISVPRANHGKETSDYYYLKGENGEIQLPGGAIVPGTNIHALNGDAIPSFIVAEILRLSEKAKMEIDDRDRKIVEVATENGALKEDIEKGRKLCEESDAARDALVRENRTLQASGAGRMDLYAMSVPQLTSLKQRYLSDAKKITQIISGKEKGEKDEATLFDERENI